MTGPPWAAAVGEAIASMTVTDRGAKFTYRLPRSGRRRHVLIDGEADTLRALDGVLLDAIAAVRDDCARDYIRNATHSHLTALRRCGGEFVRAGDQRVINNMEAAGVITARDGAFVLTGFGQLCREHLSDM